MAKYVIELNDGKIEANSRAELVALVKAEIEFWEAIPDITPNDLKLHTNFTPNWFANSFSKANDAINAWNSFDESILDDKKLSAKGVFDALVAFCLVIDSAPIHSHSTRARNVALMIENGDFDLAFVVLMKGNLKNSDVVSQLNNKSAFAAYLAAISKFHSEVYHKDSERLSSANNVIDREDHIVSLMRSDLSRKIDETSAQIDEDKKEFDKFYKEMRDRSRRSFVTSMRTAQKKFAELLEEEKLRTKGYDQLVETFNAHLRISHPVKLWEERQSEHKENSERAWKTFYRASSIFIAAIVVVMLFAGQSIANAFIAPECFGSEGLTCNSFSFRGPLVVSTLLVITTICMWFLRLQIKIFLSERHLALDARERRAFAETYLALLKGGHATTEHETVILQSLFRPTQDGIIKDDIGFDMSAAGILSKSMTPK